MLFALVPGELEKRQPISKGERAKCRCGADLTAVLPNDYSPHWRHKNGDCDPWSEPEGVWHLSWKARFPKSCCEIEIVDEANGKWHRADVHSKWHNGSGVVLELQHSYISLEDQIAREQFYGSRYKMFWLLHIHDEKSFRATHFGYSLNFGNTLLFNGKKFHRMTWYGPSKKFIERWKYSSSHVFFDHKGDIYYLATNAACASLVSSLGEGQFALSKVSADQLITAVLPPPLKTGRLFEEM